MKKFFWLCSGAHHPLLEKSPTEGSKYAGIGATIFFTGVFAAMACSYAMYTVFDNVWAAAALGLVWGLMIFNLDRYIVSSMRKEKKATREWLTATPRIALAILISVVIAKPLEMKIFEKEIRGELTMMEQQTRTEQENEIRARYADDRTRMEAEIETLKKEITDKTAERNELMRIAQEEADGTGGTKQRNAGPIYKIKKADADRVEGELQALNERNTSRITERTADIRALDSMARANIDSLVNQRLDGPAARMEALSRLTKKSAAIALANWFIILLFIALESAPVFVKLISPVGPYDHLLKTAEYTFESERAEAIAQTNDAIKGRNQHLGSLEKNYLEQQLDVNLD